MPENAGSHKTSPRLGTRERQPLGEKTPRTLNRTAYPQNSKKRAFYSPSPSSTSSTPHSHTRKTSQSYRGGSRRSWENIPPEATSSPFNDDSTASPNLHLHKAAAIKRSEGFLNLSLGETEKKHTKQSPLAKPPKKRPSKSGASGKPTETATQSPFVKPASPKKAATSRWKKIFGGSGTKESPTVPFLSPQSMQNTNVQQAHDPTIATPASFTQVKPLQTAFTDSGLQSKKSLASQNQKMMPETPCKRAPASQLVDVNGSFAPATVAASQKRLPRSERAINTTDLQSCILRFTNEFDDFYDEGNRSNTSIFTESEEAQDSTEPMEFSSPHAVPEVEDFDRMDEDIDLNNIDEMDFDGFDHLDTFPPTPTRLGNVPDLQPPRYLAQQQQDKSSPTKSRSHYWERARSSSNTSTIALINKKKLKPILNLAPGPPVLSETAPQTPVESVISLSQHAPSKLQAMEATAPDGKVDQCILNRFGSCRLIGKGEFSIVYETQYNGSKYAVKRTKGPIGGPKTRLRKLEEVEILKTLSKKEGQNETEIDNGVEYVLGLADYWEYNQHLYIMTEYCENGSLDKFLAESGKISKLDEWRVWKIMQETLLGISYIHRKGILHLDLKPANILITFDGSLKIGDFGVASKLPIPPFFDREGDREYIAPEVISRQVYTAAADIFSCGLIMIEIAANIVLPDNGASWQKLRSGDLTDAGRLSSSDLTDLDESLFSSTGNTYSSNLLISDAGQHSNGSSTATTMPFKPLSNRSRAPAWAPSWFRNGSSPLDKVVAWMIDPDPEQRPSAAQILKSYECSVVELRRKSGATIFEGDYGPRPEDPAIPEAEQCLEQACYKLGEMQVSYRKNTYR